MSNQQQSLHTRGSPAFTPAARIWARTAFVISAYFFLYAPSGMTAPVTAITKEIRYHSPDAGEIVLVWGIDGWNPIPEPLRPSGTTVKKSVMNTPMTKQGDLFLATVQAPAGSTIDFGFLITKARGGADLAVWDGNGADGYHLPASQAGIFEVKSGLSLSASGRWTVQDDSSSSGYLMIVSGAFIVMAVSAAALSYRGRKRASHGGSCQLNLRIRSRTADLLLLGAGMLAAIGLAEYGLQWLAPHGGFGAARELDWMRANPGKLSKLFTVDQELGFRPNLTGDLYNEYGTRRNRYQIEKQTGVTRLLFLGDSVTFRGTIIEALRQLYGDEGYEYWNAGVDSYNTVQEVAFYKAYNYRIRPDHVILTFHPNDFETTPVAFLNEHGKLTVYAPNRPMREMNPFLFQHSRLYRLVMGLITSEHQGEQDILQEIIQSLTTLRDTLQDDHIRLTVLVLPLLAPPDLWSSSEHERRNRILQVLKDLRIAYVDLLPPLIETIHRNIRIQESPGDIWHPSPELAEAFARHLHELKFLEHHTAADSPPQEGPARRL